MSDDYGFESFIPEIPDDKDFDDLAEETQSDCKHPEITVQLVGEDGNAFSILGAVSGAMRRAGVSKEERDQFMSEAMSGDYDHLLVTCMKWVNVL